MWIKTCLASFLWKRTYLNAITSFKFALQILYQMKICKQLAWTSLCLLFLTPSLDAQLLDRVMRRTKNKISQKAEDLIVEKASEAIARKVYKSMSDGFDKMLADAYKEDSTYQANYSDSVAIKYGAVAGTWMARMNEAADVPESYGFHYKMTAVSTHGREADEMVMYFSKDAGVFAMEQYEQKEKRLIVIDADRDVTVMYFDDGKKKTAQAIPNMMSLAGAMVNTHMADEAEQEITFEEIDGKKLIGYECRGFKMMTDDGVTTTYVTEELDVSWSKAFLESMGKFVVALNTDRYQDYPIKDGMPLATEYVAKGKKNDSYKWEVTSYEKEALTITNAEYEFGSLGGSE